MANKKATMTDLRLLIREFIKGTSKRKISEKLNLSRTSVDVYIGRIDASGKSAEELLHSDDKTLSQVMVRDSGHRNTDNEKLEELACLLGHRVEYYSMNRFIEKISMAKVDGTLLKVINHIEKNALVIFDDFGLQTLDDNSRLALLQILEDCYERKSVIITSQLPVAKWYDYIKEPTLADAIMDRLTANARRIELKGESLTRKSK